MQRGPAKQTYTAHLYVSPLDVLFKTIDVFIISQCLPWFPVQSKFNTCLRSRRMNERLDRKLTKSSSVSEAHYLRYWVLIMMN